MRFRHTHGIQVAWNTRLNMNHLIQPVEIEGSLYCMTQHGVRTTIGLDTNIIVFPTVPALDLTTNPGSPWDTYIPGFGASEISFGVGCGDTVEITIDTVGEPTDPGYPVYGMVMDVHINGNTVAQSSNPFTNTSPSGTVSISLTDEACGNVVTLVFYTGSSGSGEVYITATINTIT